MPNREVPAEPSPADIQGGTNRAERDGTERDSPPQAVPILCTGALQMLWQVFALPLPLSSLALSLIGTLSCLLRAGFGLLRIHGLGALRA